MLFWLWFSFLRLHNAALCVTTYFGCCEASQNIASFQHVQWVSVTCIIILQGSNEIDEHEQPKFGLLKLSSFI